MPPELIKLFADLGMSGVVIWLVWHTFQRSLPSMVRDFREELQRERDSTSRIVEAVERNSRLLVYLIAKMSGVDTHPLEELFDGTSKECDPCPIKSSMAKDRDAASKGVANE